MDYCHEINIYNKYLYGTLCFEKFLNFKSFFNNEIEML